MIIELKKDFDIFMNYWMNEPSIVIPIWCDHELHPMMTDISFLYIRFRDEESSEGVTPMDFILPYNHNDCETINFRIDLSKTIQKHLVWNMKGVQQLDPKITIPNSADLHGTTFFKDNQHLDLEGITEPLTNFYKFLGLHDYMGSTISIMRYKEVLRTFTNPLLGYIPTIENSWVSSVLIRNLSLIEKNGILVDTEKFFERWPGHEKFVDNHPFKVYTEYNPYTLTSRPSNRHGGINFGALNKKDGTRECFIPSSDSQFVQFDYDAYHVRIIGNLISYELPETSAHQWLADMYGCSYEESKGRTFRILYGGVSEEDKKIPFFKQVDVYIQLIWKHAVKDGYFKTKKGRIIYLDWIDDVNPQKMFNYLLQATETELNMEIIGKLPEDAVQKLVLYQYDSFLFDIPLGTDTTYIKKILESYGFPVNMTRGDDYSKV